MCCAISLPSPAGSSAFSQGLESHGSAVSSAQSEALVLQLSSSEELESC